MIPRANITAWRSRAPWPTDAQVEQDLVLSRALVDLYGNPSVAQAVAFRGGTALHKLFFTTPGRYSEDIDLVQIGAGPIGPILDAIRASLDPWLGEPKRKQSQGRVTMIYRFETTTKPVQLMRLKVEINTREHFAVLGIQSRPFVVDNPWFSGNADIGAYRIEEMLGTKLRALYQRKKGRDLYDLWLALTSLEVDDEKVADCFVRYLEHDGLAVSRAEFEGNLNGKLEFFTRLIRAGVKRVIDIRLNNVSQLAGFAKREDLRYFLRTIGGIDYLHRPDLAPTQQILDAFKKSKGSWPVYERDFLALLSARGIEREITPELLNKACLLCSEEKPVQCHRRTQGAIGIRMINNKDINIRMIIHDDF